MRHLELIRLRTSTVAAARAELSRIAAALHGHRTLMEASILVHAVVEGDLALQLVWEAFDTPHGTDAGQVAAEQLRAFGLVDHTTWVDVTGRLGA